MVAIVKTAMTNSGAREVTETTMTSSDTFSYDQGENAVMIMRNATGGSLTVNFDGDGANTVPVAGIGNVDVSGGFDVVIPDGDTFGLPLNTIRHYLTGTIAITGGTGISASILTF